MHRQRLGSGYGRDSRTAERPGAADKLDRKTVKDFFDRLSKNGTGDRAVLHIIFIV